MSWLASNLITWFAPRSNMSAPSSHEITRPLNSMIGVLALIGRAANNPMPLIGDLRFCHNRFRCRSLISLLIVRLNFAAPSADGCKPTRDRFRLFNLGLQSLHQSLKATQRLDRHMQLLHLR